MKIKKKIILITFMFVTTFCWSQETNKKISVSIPTIEQEATSVWRTINDIEFFEQNGYNVFLPTSEIIDSLLIKSRKKTFGNIDYSSIYELLESKIYSKQDYLMAFRKVQEQKQSINSMILQLDSLKKSWNWDFKMFENYQILFTLYGSGGSYDQTTGTITLFVTKEGNFKMYSNPINTIIHEIIHIGIEESIVQQYKLPHTIKERIVDKIVFLLFSDLLPEYKIQNMGDTYIDNQLKEKNDILNLKKIIANSNK